MRSQSFPSRAEAKAAATPRIRPLAKGYRPQHSSIECAVSRGHQVQLALGSVSQETSLGFRFSQGTWVLTSAVLLSWDDELGHHFPSHGWLTGRESWVISLYREVVKNHRTTPNSRSLARKTQTHCPYFKGRAWRQGVLLFPPNFPFWLLKKSAPRSLCEAETGWRLGKSGHNSIQPARGPTLRLRPCWVLGWRTGTA